MTETTTEAASRSASRAPSEDDVRHLKPPDSARWDELVEQSPGASIFHTAAWASLWTSEWRRARWEALVLEDGSGYAAGIGAIVRPRGFWRTIDAMPYATHGGPIVRRGHPDPAGARKALLQAFEQWTSGRRVLRAQLAWPGGREEEFPEDLPHRESFTHVLPLGRDYAMVASEFASSTRRLVRQAEESGLSIRPAASPDDVRAFIALANETVRRRGGEPKPASLYERIAADLAPAGLARFHLVTHGDEPVAGSLHLFHEGVATSWLPVSRASAWHLRPNNFLVAHVLESLCGAGYLEYDFGASPPDADGLIRFKEGWGAVRRPVWIAERRSGLHRRLRG
ncbi:MAG TPA: GNAT family N-acetyltransferase [Candidatus Eisenbacteria bacterium]|nr:GNAT family N-acetyltransferase [Candidatus Eisenbacteria bacterium]